MSGYKVKPLPPKPLPPNPRNKTKKLPPNPVKHPSKYHYVPSSYKPSIMDDDLYDNPNTSNDDNKSNNNKSNNNNSNHSKSSKKKKKKHKGHSKSFRIQRFNTNKPSYHLPSKTKIIKSRSANNDFTNQKILNYSQSDIDTETDNDTDHENNNNEYKYNNNNNKNSKKIIINKASMNKNNNNNNDYISDKCGNINWVRNDLIGIGAFGKVYKGFDKNSNKILAIKQIIFDPNIINNNDNDNMTIIDREAKVMQSLKHKNIVQFYGYTKSIKYKCLCILMEYVAGNNIEVLYTKNGKFSEKMIKTYSKQMLSALKYAHKKNIIHRDIKGKNILITGNGIAKLADFGSAKITSTTLGGGNDKFAPSLNYNYTPLWTAPEVLIGEYNQKIDIWSLGCVIIEMSTAKYPWNEKHFENPFTALYHIGHSDKIPKYPNELSKKLKNFLNHCLVRDPKKRLDASALLNHEFLDD